MQCFPMPEGRVVNYAGTLKQEFILTDQQGNARLAFQDAGNSTPVVTQENSYYAFGLIMPNSPVATPSVPNKQLYNGGSEWQNDYSNNLPDYYQTYFRNYDAAIARFVGVDPTPESAESMTSYQYSNNNPIMYNDPLGNKAGDIVDGQFQQYNAQTDFRYWENSSSAWNKIENSGGNGGGNYGGFWTGFLSSGQSFADYKAAYDQSGGHLNYNFTLGGIIDGITPNYSDQDTYTRKIIETDEILTDGQGGQFEHIVFGYQSISADAAAGLLLQNGLGANQGGPYPRGAIGGPIPYYGNFLGPGPDGPDKNPYKLLGYDGKPLKPVDMIDAASQRHDYAYWKLGASGVNSALWQDRTGSADRALAYSAWQVVDMYSRGINDSITHQPITKLEFEWASRVEEAFGILGGLKYIGNIMGR